MWSEDAVPDQVREFLSFLLRGTKNDTFLHMVIFSHSSTVINWAIFL